MRLNIENPNENTAAYLTRLIHQYESATGRAPSHLRVRPDEAGAVRDACGEALEEAGVRITYDETLPEGEARLDVTGSLEV